MPIPDDSNAMPRCDTWPSHVTKFQAAYILEVDTREIPRLIKRGLIKTNCGMIETDSLRALIRARKYAEIDRRCA